MCTSYHGYLPMPPKLRPTWQGRDLYPQRGNIWKSPPLVSSALKARLRYERTWSKAGLAKAGWFRHIHCDANLSCSSSTHLPWFNIKLNHFQLIMRCSKRIQVPPSYSGFKGFSGSLLLGFARKSSVLWHSAHPWWHDVLYICKIVGERNGGPCVGGCPLFELFALSAFVKVLI